MKNSRPMASGKFVSPFNLYPFTFYPALAFCFALCASFTPGLHAEEFSKVSHHAARLFSYGTLVIDSRTGDLYIEGWDEPRVEIEAEKVVRAGSEAKAKPLYGLIQVRLEGGDKEVRLTTIYPSRKLWRPFRDESRFSVN